MVGSNTFCETLVAPRPQREGFFKERRWVMTKIITIDFRNIL